MPLGRGPRTRSAIRGYPSASDPWWSEIVVGLPEGPIVRDSMVDLLPAPGLGLDLDPEAVRKYLGAEDAGFFA